MARCDLNTMGECSCEASGIACRVQQPINLGSFTGTKHPAATDDPEPPTFGQLVMVALIFIGLILGYALQAGPINV